MINLVFDALHDMGHPEISVIYLTYNQANYIKEGIEAILAQKGVDFEIIWGDDASTDSTNAIITDYKNRFSDKIKIPFVGTENVGRINNMKRCIEAARGKYIAICEGDDVWVNSNMLIEHKRVMEEHPETLVTVAQSLLEYTEGYFVFHPAQTELMKRGKSNLSLNDVVKFQPTVSLSAMFFKKKVWDSLPTKLWTTDFADYFMALYCAYMNVHGIKLIHSFIKYRIHSGGLWSGLSNQKKENAVLKTHQFFTKIFGHKF